VVLDQTEALTEVKSRDIS